MSKEFLKDSGQNKDEPLNIRHGWNFPLQHARDVECTKTVLSCTSLHRINLAEPKDKFICSVSTWPDWLHQNKWPQFEATSPGLMLNYVFSEYIEILKKPLLPHLLDTVFPFYVAGLGVGGFMGGGMLVLYCRTIDF